MKIWVVDHERGDGGALKAGLSGVISEMLSEHNQRTYFSQHAIHERLGVKGLERCGC